MCHQYKSFRTTSDIRWAGKEFISLPYWTICVRSIVPADQFGRHVVSQAVTVLSTWRIVEWYKFFCSVSLWQNCLSENCIQIAGTFLLSLRRDFSCFSGSGIFLERWPLRDVIKQRADVGKGERLFLGGKWSATGTLLMNSSWRDI